ncbi:putative transcription regulator A20-like family [Helianthus anomalus]
MAQRTEKEETEFKNAPETLTLCVNNCGVVASPATNNMCQNCFNASSTTSSQRRSGSARSPARSTSTFRDDSVDLVVDRTILVEENEIKQKTTSVLPDLGARCGDPFCGEHRYSDQHDCTYDYKTAGREAIERENPVVKAAKIMVEIDQHLEFSVSIVRFDCMIFFFTIGFILARMQIVGDDFWV